MIPRKGGKEVQFTHFDSAPGSFAAYAWSQDGKNIALPRAGDNDSDVVIFGGFR